MGQKGGSVEAWVCSVRVAMPHGTSRLTADSSKGSSGGSQHRRGVPATGVTAARGQKDTSSARPLQGRAPAVLSARAHRSPPGPIPS